MQLEMFDSLDTKSIINVAKVKFRSPFRYPGGKTWLVPHVYKWFLKMNELPRKFIEPFAGGGIVGLSVAFENLADTVVLVELDEDIAAVWETILSDHAEWLAEKIAAFDLTEKNVDRLLKEKAKVKKELAFQVIVKNRVNRGGILATGAGRIKTGEGGKGIKSRWYPETLKKRILDIAAIRDKIIFIHGDGIEVIRENSNEPECVFFIDPPYTAGEKKAGKRLYTYSETDHEKLFGVTSKVAGEYLITYSNDPKVVELAEKFGMDQEPIAMKNTHHAKMTELLIGKNLDWAR